MTSDDIRRTFLEFFEAQDHLRLPSGSLVPAEHDRGTLRLELGVAECAADSGTGLNQHFMSA